MEKCIVLARFGTDPKYIHENQIFPEEISSQHIT